MTESGDAAESGALQPAELAMFPMLFPRRDGPRTGAKEREAHQLQQKRRVPAERTGQQCCRCSNHPVAVPVVPS